MKTCLYPAERTLAILAIVILFAASSVLRNSLWADEISLYEDTAGKAPLKERVLLNLSAAYGKAGRLEQSLVAVQRLMMVTNSPDSSINLGNILAERGRYAEAKVLYVKAEGRVQPGDMRKRPKEGCSRKRTITLDI